MYTDLKEAREWLQTLTPKRPPDVGNVRDDLQQRNASRYPGMISLPDGWDQLVADLIVDLERIAPDYRIDQVKAKFGGLRFYAYANLQPEEPAQALRNDLFREAIATAEDRAWKTCSLCGEPGALRQWKVLCGRCANAEGIESLAIDIDRSFPDTLLGASLLKYANDRIVHLERIAERLRSDNNKKGQEDAVALIGLLESN